VIFEKSSGKAWHRPKAFPPHPGSTLHVWRVDLNRLKESSLEIDLLSIDEVGRANRLRASKSRWRFQASRIALRKILAAYMECTPSELKFGYGDAGKPTLKAHHKDRELANLSFNLSHSDQLALLAVSGTGSVGVDVEKIRERPAIDRIVQRHFSPKEREGWLMLGTSDRLTEFYRVWTRKEALLKASSLGLSWPLTGADSLRGVIDQASFWLKDLDLGSNFTGAVACERVPSEVHLWGF
jgi:4'-phosphopantetheinyl transferase